MCIHGRGSSLQERDGNMAPGRVCHIFQLTQEWTPIALASLGSACSLAVRRDRAFKPWFPHHCEPTPAAGASNSWPPAPPVPVTRQYADAVTRYQKVSQAPAIDPDQGDY